MEGVGSALRSVISRVEEATAKRSSVRVVFVFSVMSDNYSRDSRELSSSAFLFSGAS